MSGIFLHSVDRFEEDSEHEVSNVQRSNTMPLLQEKTSESSAFPAQSQECWFLVLVYAFPSTSYFAQSRVSLAYFSVHLLFVEVCVCFLLMEIIEHILIYVSPC